MASRSSFSTRPLKRTSATNYKVYDNDGVEYTSITGQAAPALSLSASTIVYSDFSTTTEFKLGHDIPGTI